MAKITISQGLNWRKTLQQRHAELIQLRNENSREENHYGANVKTIEKKPRYDVVELDKAIVLIARQMRLLDDALKNTNATVHVKNYEQNDDVLGELVPAKVA